MQARNAGGQRSWTLMLMLAALAALSPCSTFPLSHSITIRPLAQAWARKLGTEDRCALSSIRASRAWETAAMQVRVCYAAATWQR